MIFELHSAPQRLLQMLWTAVLLLFHSYSPLLITDPLVHLMDLFAFSHLNSPFQHFWTQAVSSSKMWSGMRSPGKSRSTSGGCRMLQAPEFLLIGHSESYWPKEFQGWTDLDWNSESLESLSFIQPLPPPTPPLRPRASSSSSSSSPPSSSQFSSPSSPSSSSSS